jgi:hypothetical protein
MAEAETCVEMQQRAEIGEPLRGAIELQPSRLDIGEIDGREPDAMAVVAGEVRADQMVRDDERLFRPAARGGEDAPHELRQRLRFNPDVRHL